MTDKDAGRRIELFRQNDELSRCQAIANASKRRALRIEGWIGLGSYGRDRRLFRRHRREHTQQQEGSRLR